MLPYTLMSSHQDNNLKFSKNLSSKSSTGANEAFDMQFLQYVFSLSKDLWTKEKSHLPTSPKHKLTYIGGLGIG